MRKKTILEKKRFVFFFQTLKPVSNQTKVQNFLKIIFITKHIKKLESF
jgi:hypothetical protein